MAACRHPQARTSTGLQRHGHGVPPRAPRNLPAPLQADPFGPV